MTTAEAETMLAELKKHFKEPVLPLSRVCAALDTWAQCIRERNEGSEGEEDLTVVRYKQGKDYHHLLGRISIDIRKSNLLGRLLYANQLLRTQKCPIHQGRWDPATMFKEACPHKCHGTGWLPERPEDGWYTGGIFVAEVDDHGTVKRIIDPYREETQ